MKRTDLAYLAGILDGEGSISIHKHKDKNSQLGYYYQLVINVANTNEWLINWIHLNFGGNIYKKRMLAKHYKQVYLWSASSNQAKTLLELILPYLRLKKAQADIALQFQAKKHPRGSVKSEEEFVLEEAQRILIQSYNDCRRGKSEEVKE